MGYSSLLLLLLFASNVFSDRVADTVVKTTFGNVRGTLVDNALIFKGIPYAGPVDGANRWKDSQFPEPWDGIFDANREGIGCPQVCDLPSPKFTCPTVQVENCLVLNIYTSADQTAAKNMPVLVFIHGGEFVTGFGGSELYDGRYLVSSGIILVTINYRLGALGNIVYGSGDNALIGNFAIKDQRLALEWIKMNIAAFGGDPNDVTIAGQSAGGISVALHMISVKSSGLFQKAIVESNPFAAPLKTITESRILGQEFARALGCGIHDDYDCLYSKSFTEVANATHATNSKIIDVFKLLEIFLQWTPVVDYDEVMGQPLTLFQQGKVADVPAILGTTSQEAVLFLYRSVTESMNTVLYDAITLAVFPLHFQAISDLYPPARVGDNRPLLSVLGTDEAFNCPTRLAARSLSNQTSRASPVFHYIFDHVWSFERGWEPYSMYNACRNASCHGAELPFVFKTAGLGGYKYTSNEQALTDNLVKYFTNFVKYGNPNGQDITLLNWSAYTENTKWPTMILKTPQNEVVSNYRTFYCDHLDEIGYNV